MDTQDGQDINLYHVYPVHPCELKKISIWDIISCELPYTSKYPLSNQKYLHETSLRDIF